MNRRLKEIKKRLDQGSKDEKATVRELLAWFDAKRRGSWIVDLIRNELDAAGIVTNPDFNAAWIDSEIVFSIAKPKIAKLTDELSATGGDLATKFEPDVDPTAEVFRREPTIRLSRFAASNQGVAAVNSNATLYQAITTMLSCRFSQLPIMDNKRDVKGIISWESIGKLLTQGAKVERAMDARIDHQELLDSASIFDAVIAISRHDYILVRSSTNREISGIMTATDLGKQFNDLAEPFLLLNEIENQIRSILDNLFTIEELKEVCSETDASRKDNLKSVSDLNFGEYIRLIEKPERWQKLPFKADRNIVIQELERVRKTRNDVMHFDPDGIDPESISHLRRVASFLNELAAIALRNKQAQQTSNKASDGRKAINA